MVKNLEGKTYHIEGNGEFITIDSLNCDKMPRLDNNGVKIDLSEELTIEKTEEYKAA